MSDKPECGEVGVESFRKHEIKVGLDIGGARQADIVAQNAEFRSVGYYPPQGSVFGIEIFLHQSMGRLFPPVESETIVGPVKIEVAGYEQERHGTVTGAMRQPEQTIFQHDAVRDDQIIMAKDLLQQRLKPLFDIDLRITQVLSRATFGMVSVEIVGDTPVSGEFFLDCQRLR